MSVSYKNGIPNNTMTRTKFKSIDDLSDGAIEYLVINILAIKEWSRALDKNETTYETPELGTRTYRSEKRKFEELLQRLHSQKLSIAIPNETTATPSPIPIQHANRSVLQFCQQRGNASLYNLQNRVSNY